VAVGVSVGIAVGGTGVGVGGARVGGVDVEVKAAVEEGSERVAVGATGDAAGVATGVRHATKIKAPPNHRRSSHLADRLSKHWLAVKSQPF